MRLNPHGRLMMDVLTKTGRRVERRTGRRMDELITRALYAPIYDATIPNRRQVWINLWTGEDPRLRTRRLP